MKLLCKFLVTSLLLTLITAQSSLSDTVSKRKSSSSTTALASSKALATSDEAQPRTLGLLGPLLSIGLGGLSGRPLRTGTYADSVILPTRPVRTGTLANNGILADPTTGGGYGGYYGGYPNGYGTGYRPAVANPAYGGYYGGYQNPFAGIFANYGQAAGYPGIGYGGNYRPPVTNPAYAGYNGGYPNAYAGAYGNVNAYRPNVGYYGAYAGGYPNNGQSAGYPSYAGYLGAYQPTNYGGTLASTGTTPGGSIATTSGAYGSGATANVGQQAQIASLLGQVLGSSLRPLLAAGTNAGGLNAATSPAGLGAGPITGLLGLFG